MNGLFQKHAQRHSQSRYCRMSAGRRSKGTVPDTQYLYTLFVNIAVCSANRQRQPRTDSSECLFETVNHFLGDSALETPLAFVNYDRPSLDRARLIELLINPIFQCELGSARADFSCLHIPSTITRCLQVYLVSESKHQKYDVD